MPWKWLDGEKRFTKYLSHFHEYLYSSLGVHILEHALEMAGNKSHISACFLPNGFGLIWNRIINPTTFACSPDISPLERRRGSCHRPELLSMWLSRPVVLGRHTFHSLLQRTHRYHPAQPSMSFRDSGMHTKRHVSGCKYSKCLNPSVLLPWEISFVAVPQPSKFGFWCP